MILAALSPGRAILIGVASGVAVILVALAGTAGLRRPRKPPELDIPRGLRPGPADPDLEKPLLERHILVAALLTVAMAIWIPAVWLREPVSNRDDTKTELAQSVQRGYLTSLPGGEANQIGFNCVRCHGSGLHGGQNVYNGNVVPVPNLQTVCGGSTTGHPLIKSLDDVINTIAQGRDGTDMPSWSVRFKGPMDDQQINDLVNYILSIQKVPTSQNVCLAAPKPAASPSPGGTAGASPSPSPSK